MSDSAVRPCTRSPRLAPVSGFPHRWAALRGAERAEAKEERRKRQPRRGSTSSSCCLRMIQDEVLRLPNNGLLLWITCHSDRRVDWKPLDAINLAVVVGWIPFTESQKIKRHDLEHPRRGILPLGHVGILDAVDLCDDRSGQACLFSRFA